MIVRIVEYIRAKAYTDEGESIVQQDERPQERKKESQEMRGIINAIERIGNDTAISIEYIFNVLIANDKRRRILRKSNLTDLNQKLEKIYWEFQSAAAPAGLPCTRYATVGKFPREYCIQFGLNPNNENWCYCSLDEGIMRVFLHADNSKPVYSFSHES